ncbi:MAG: DUF4426 domain-containing protein [Gammaproteobacteria bacterium]|nr:DUF4426 domain-containing protein [Gammaproteobacteria bacterium]
MARPSRIQSFAGLFLAAALVGCSPNPDSGEARRSGAPASVSEELYYKDFGSYTLHYNALGTDHISPEIAKAYGITRSPNRAMINVSILRKNEGAAGTPVRGEVVAQVVNLTGQLKSVDMRQITEGEAIYYIGELNVANAETLQITISATPEGERRVLSVRYQKQFFDH